MQQKGNQIQKKGGLPRLYLTCAFLPESSDKFRSGFSTGTRTKAGLLTYSAFLRPSRLYGAVALGSKKAVNGAYSIG